ncbi:hypothetical protein LCGC14_2894360 [marine sediment metagenome]|uniref:Uncharacterized protein n=1 Tax=marine sediment metagenome TaxID=412755 RepID=A0A0F9A474_9ZZZZ
MKIHTNISIDNDLRKKAEQANLNISGLTEHAIKEKLNYKDVTISTDEACKDCGRPGPKEKASNINKDPHAMTWLYPDEIWLCNICLRRRYMQVHVGHR